MNEWITSDIAPVLSENFLDIQAAECRFTLKRIYDMIRTHKPCGFMCVYESRCFDFESSWCDSNISHALSEQSINIQIT